MTVTLLSIQSVKSNCFPNSFKCSEHPPPPPQIILQVYYQIQLHIKKSHVPERTGAWGTSVNGSSVRRVALLCSVHEN